MKKHLLALAAALAITSPAGASQDWEPPGYLLPGTTEAFRILDQELFPVYQTQLGLAHQLARTVTELYHESPISPATINLATDRLMEEGVRVWKLIPAAQKKTPPALKLHTVMKAYAYARRALLESLEEPDDDDDADPPSLGFVPSTYPIAWTDQHGTTSTIAAAINSRQVHETEDALIVYCKQGRVDGFTIGDGGWTPTPQAKPWWDRDKTLVIVGHPDGTTLKGLPSKGWGSTVNLQEGGNWEGRVHVVDLVVEASGSNCFQIGDYGASEIRYMVDVALVNVDLVANPDPEVRCIRPISANQVDLTLDGVTCDIPNAWEHYGYTRNCRNVTIANAFVRATGGQVWQDVARPSEGPYLGRGSITFQGIAHNFHRDPSRAGSGLTFAGGNKDVVVRDSIVWDNPDEDPDRDFGYGLQTTWDGGFDNHYDLPSGRSNGHVLIEDSYFLSVAPNRSPMKFSDCESVTLNRCGFYWGGSKTIDIRDNALPWKASGCNSPEIFERARELLIEAGLDDKLWILDKDPQVRLIDRGELLGEIDSFN